MSEGNVYLCDYRKAGGKYKLWVIDQPSLLAEATTFQQAYEELWDRVFDEFEDGEAVLEFARGLPKGEGKKRYTEPALVTVAGNDYVSAELDGSWDELYKGGVCAACREPLGERTDVQAKIVLNAPVADGFILSNRGASVYCFSDRFVQAIMSLPGSNVSFRPCTTSRKGGYHELLGPALVNEVAVKSLGSVDREIDPTSKLSGFSCRQCGATSFVYLDPVVRIMSFVAKSDLPEQVPDAFTVGRSGSVALCLRADTWRKLAEQKFKNIASSTLGVVNNRDVVRNPVLREEY